MLNQQKEKENKLNIYLNKQESLVKIWKGCIPFVESLELQENLKKLALKNQSFLLSFESVNPVITKGLRTKPEDILWSKKDLDLYRFEECSLKRGGQATLHSPGQLVIYPVIKISSFNLKLKEFILSLEDITQKVLKDLDISSKRTEEYAGLSTKKGKIAFFGIHISDGVSQHGLSINIKNDLNLFSSIRSCGVLRRTHDRICFYNPSLSTKDLFYLWARKFAEHYGI